MNATFEIFLNAATCTNALEAFVKTLGVKVLRRQYGNGWAATVDRFYVTVAADDKEAIKPVLDAWPKSWGYSVLLSSAFT